MTYPYDIAAEIARLEQSGYDGHPLDYTGDLAADERAPEDAFRDDVEKQARWLRVQREAREQVSLPPAEKPEVLTLRERLALPRVIVPDRIAGWQKSGHHVTLSAQRKAGKTRLVQNLCRSLVDGDHFLGAYEVTALPPDVTVVVLDFEMDPDQLDEDLGDQQIVNDHRVIVIPLRGKASTFDIRKDSVRADWADIIGSRACGYLVHDCLRPVLDAFGLSEDK
jgi:AAA domain